MEVSIKGMYTLVFIALFSFLMIGLLALNINNHQATKLTISIVNAIQQNNGLDSSLQDNIDSMAQKYESKVNITEINSEYGKKYQVSVTFKSTIGIIGFEKEFTKSKITQLIMNE